VLLLEARAHAHLRDNNVSQDAYDLLKNKYGAVPRGAMQVKGKGQMYTYYLLNMPVEQQSALQALAAEEGKATAQVFSVVDRWARKGKTGAPMTPQGRTSKTVMMDSTADGGGGTPELLPPRSPSDGSPNSKGAENPQPDQEANDAATEKDGSNNALSA